MSNILYSILGFVIAIGLLTAIHEYGHFWVARRLGVKVLRFSIGFGKVLFSRRDGKGTQYALCAIPLGGYVKMLDQNEAPVPHDELHLAYNKKPVWARMLIIAAGPICNILFALCAYWVVFMMGISSLVPVIGDVPPNTPAYHAGLHAGQEIMSIEGHETPTWEDVVVALAAHSGDHDKVNMTMRDIKDHTTSTHVFNLENWSIQRKDESFLVDLGLTPFDPTQPIIGKVLPGYPAAAAGLQKGDQIVSLNGTKVQNIAQTLQYIQDKTDKPVHMVVDRKGHQVSVTLIPVRKVQEHGVSAGFIGIQFAKQPLPKQFIRVQHFGPIDSMQMSWSRTKEYSLLTLQFIGKMITGKMSLENMSGPLGIAQYAGVTVRSGLETFLSFLALVSISLGILNMLPIPVLDGGHFLFCVIELIRGKALSVRAMNVGIAIGFVILGSVMIIALYNDISRILH